MNKYKYQKVLRVGSSPPYDKDYSRLYIKLPVSWCRGRGITKGSWLRITENGDKLIIEQEGEE